MGFLSNAFKTVVNVLESPVHMAESTFGKVPVGKQIVDTYKKYTGYKDQPLTSVMGEYHREARSPLGQAAFPVVGSIAGSFFGPYGTTLGAMIGKAVADAEANKSDTQMLKNAVITGATAYGAQAAGGAAFGAAGKGTSGMFAGAAAGGATGGAVNAGAQGWANNRPMNETLANMGRGAAIGAGTSLAGTGAGYGLTNGTPIYNSEPGTDFSGGMNYQPGMMSNMGGRVASTGVGTSLNMAWKPYMNQQAPLWSNPLWSNSYVQQGMSSQAQVPPEESYNPFGKLGERFEQSPFSEAPVTEQERQINRLLARQQVSGLGPLSPFLAT